MKGYCYVFEQNVYHISVSHVNKLVINKNIFQANTFLLVIHVSKYSGITHIATLAWEPPIVRSHKGRRGY